MRLVIKTGSATLSKKNGGLDSTAVARIARQLAKAHLAGHDVIVVSSGAIAAGVGRLGLKERPRDLQLKQATAAVGQVALMKAYEEALAQCSTPRAPWYVVPANRNWPRNVLVARVVVDALERLELRYPE